MADNINNPLFQNLKQPTDLTSYNLMYGTTDFGDLKQFNMYEGGYAALFVIKIPKFMEELAKKNDQYKNIVNTYKHILEREFKSLDGLGDITTDSLEINDGVTTVNVIGKVNLEGSREFTMRYQEKSGSVITRFHELYLRGIRDPRGSQVKHYHGLIADGTIPEPGFDKETFTFLYINTDNTMRKIEKAYLIVAAWLTDAKTNIYNYDKGDIAFKDVDVTFNGFPITSNEIDALAQKYLDWMHSTADMKLGFTVNTDNYKYSGVEDIQVPASGSVR